MTICSLLSGGETIRMKKETQFIFNFPLTMCQGEAEKEKKNSKANETRSERKTLLTKLGIRFLFHPCLHTAWWFCDLLRFENDNYPGYVYTKLKHGGHLALGTWSAFYLISSVNIMTLQVLLVSFYSSHVCFKIFFAPTLLWKYLDSNGLKSQTL